MGDAREAFRIGQFLIEPGHRRNIEIPLARLYTHARMGLPVEVLHGREEGPRLFVSATLHGDEINGVEIVRRVLDRLRIDRLRGTLVAVPIVNVFGFVNQSRYLPDRRDLNRSFPGSSSGSLAARLASLFMKEIVLRCGFGIDIHTAAPPRTNLPQVRADLRDPQTRACVEAFGAPVMIHGAGPDKSLRREAHRKKVRVIVYEGGEPHRFNDETIRLGVSGVLRVMHHLGMVGSAPRTRFIPSREVVRTRWVRARQSGILRLDTPLGALVEKGEELGVISDPFGDGAVPVKALVRGLVIGRTVNPLVYRGEAVVHLAQVKEGQKRHK